MHTPALPGFSDAQETAPAQIQIGTPEFQRVKRALFFGGFSTFALLYCVQPLMPLFSHEFHLSPSESSWSLSISTAALAICLLFASAVSDALGRKPLMCFALFASAAMTVCCAFAQNYAQLLVCRALLGIVLAGLPAVAMAYLSEEIEPKSLGYAMGLYIGGSAFGGMMGRVVSSVLSDHLSWRIALLIVGVAGLAAAAEFLRSLPASRNFSKRPLSFAAMPASVIKHFSDEGLPWFFLIGFLLMGCFVSLYNYISYRLLGPEFGLSQSAVGAISSLYLLGIFSSVWSGKMADKFGRRRVLWMLIVAMLSGLLLTLAHGLALIVGGIALFTFGFFGGHSITSSWVGRRARPPQALASALYLFAYYLGSSLIGSCSGLVWKFDDWNGVVMVLATLLIAAVAISLRLSRLAQLQPLPA
ncbi:MFS transporter [Undibacterium sp. TJN25]|uniref:MFS transporter n=1 Tax=Undibacterium sp. TJN25 TaxID=3413056 RepID=UPI003BEFE6CE